MKKPETFSDICLILFQTLYGLNPLDEQGEEIRAYTKWCYETPVSKLKDMAKEVSDKLNNAKYN